MLTLFHAPRSRSSRLVWLLEEMGQPYELEYVSIRGRPGGGRDPKNPHPHGKVPALVHDGTLITESIAICLYLTDAFPEAGLGPKIGDPDRADYLTWLAYYAGAMEPAFTAKATDWKVEPAMAAWDSFEAVEQRLADTLAKGPWVLGERFSSVDVLVGSLLQWAARLFPEREQYEAYKARMAERPALKRALAKDDEPEGDGKA